MARIERRLHAILLPLFLSFVFVDFVLLVSKCVTRAHTVVIEQSTRTTTVDARFAIARLMQFAFARELDFGAFRLSTHGAEHRVRIGGGVIEDQEFLLGKNSRKNAPAERDERDDYDGKSDGGDGLGDGDAGEDAKELETGVE